MPPPHYNFLVKSVNPLILTVVFAQFLFSCVQEHDLPIPQDEAQLIRIYMEGELSGKNTFDNQPIELDWERMKVSKEYYEIPLQNPLKGFVPKYSELETRLLVPRSKIQNYSFLTMDAEEIGQDFSFSELLSDQERVSLVNYNLMKFTKDLDSEGLEYHRSQNSDPNAWMPVECEPVTIIYVEKTCYWIGGVLYACTEWQEVSREEVEVCGNEGLVGGNYNTTKIIKDESFEDTKADCVLEKLRSSSGGYKKMIKKFDGEFPVSHLSFSLDYNMPDTINGTTSSSSISSYYIDIKLNGNTLAARPILGIARTLAHETIHAEMYRKVKSVGGIVSMNDFPGIYDYYTNYKDWQHEQMANHYIDTMVEILRDFDNNQHSDSYYSDLAWEGLQGTQAWSSLPQTDKNRIVNTIININQNGSKICN